MSSRDCSRWFTRSVLRTPRLDETGLGATAPRLLDVLEPHGPDLHGIKDLEPDPDTLFLPTSVAVRLTF